MRRRDLLALLAAAALVGADGAMAQHVGRLRRVGVLVPYPETDSEVQARVAAFRQELERLGWSVGKNLKFEERWATDNLDRIRNDAAEIVKLEPDVILTTGSRVVPIVQRQTRAIPIIFVGTTDPVGQGFVDSLARPGGNTTGFSQSELTGETSPVITEMFELLTEIAPNITRAALIFNSDNPAAAFHSRSFAAAAAALNIRPVTYPVRQPVEIEGAIATFAQEPNGGVLLPSDLTLLAQRQLVTTLIAGHRLPAVYSDRAFVTSGGLISYSADRTDMFRRAASYVHRILSGERPGDLPVQQPTRYELVVNLKTAKVLGLVVPPSILLRADEVIE